MERKFYVIDKEGNKREEGGEDLNKLNSLVSSLMDEIETNSDIVTDKFNVDPKEKLVIKLNAYFNLFKNSLGVVINYNETVGKEVLNQYTNSLIKEYEEFQQHKGTNVH